MGQAFPAMAASPLISTSLGHTSSAQASASSLDINPVLKRYRPTLLLSGSP
jgi:hypothetical protein